MILKENCLCIKHVFEIKFNFIKIIYESLNNNKLLSLKIKQHKLPDQQKKKQKYFKL